MGLWDTFSKNIATAGEAIGLPEWGISEFFSSPVYGAQTQPYVQTPQGSYVSSGAQIQNAPVYGPTYSGPQTQQPTVQVPQQSGDSGGGGGGGGGGGVDRMAAWRNLGNTGDLPVGWFGPYTREGIAAKDAESAASAKAIQDQRNAQMEQQRLAAVAAKEKADAATRTGISSKYQTIYDEFNRRLGLLPEQQAEIELSISNIAKSLASSAEEAEKAPFASLALARTQEGTRSEQTLRELAQKGGEALRAAKMILGPTSAVPAVATAMTREISREQGKVMQARNDVYAQLDQKEVELKSLTAQNKNEIEVTKQQEMMKIAQEYRGRDDEINAKLTTAQGEEANALISLQIQNYNDASQRLLDLDNRIASYNDSVDLYAATTAQDLAKYKQQLEIASQYTQGDYGFDLSSLSPSQASKLAQESGQDFNYGGFNISGAKEEEEEIRWSNNIPYKRVPGTDDWAPMNVIGGSTNDAWRPTG